jgi:hypothetical protein
MSLAAPDGADTRLTEFESVLCVNIVTWIDDVASRRFDGDASAVLRFLIDAANAQSKVWSVSSIVCAC